MDTPFSNPAVKISAKVLRMKNNFPTSVVSDFGQASFGSNTHSGFTVGAQSGYIPHYQTGSLAVTQAGKLYMAHTGDDALLFFSNGSYGTYKFMPGIVSVASCKKSLYVAVAPVYDAALTMTQWPRIYEIDSLGISSLYYEFPSALSFAGPGAYGGGGNIMHPLGFLMDLKMDASGSLYVAFGSDNKIYELDKNKILSVYNSTIYCPVSIALDNFNKKIIASAPEYSNGNMIKPVQLYKDEGTGIPDKIYDGVLSPMGGLRNFSITVGQQNKIFLSSPLDGSVTLIQ